MTSRVSQPLPVLERRQPPTTLPSSPIAESLPRGVTGCPAQARACPTVLQKDAHSRGINPTKAACLKQSSLSNCEARTPAPAHPCPRSCKVFSWDVHTPGKRTAPGNRQEAESPRHRLLRS